MKQNVKKSLSFSLSAVLALILVDIIEGAEPHLCFSIALSLIAGIVYFCILSFCQRRKGAKA